jgi:crotonobetainyl-CoA:carnitine CoA-transferase CaiB-like acyl-CoA transferase
VEPVLTFSDACNHEQIKDREMLASVPLADGSFVKQIAHPIKMSRSEPKYRYAGVKLGEHNVDILDEMAVDSTLRDCLLSTRAMG